MFFKYEVENKLDRKIKRFFDLVGAVNIIRKFWSIFVRKMTLYMSLVLVIFQQKGGAEQIYKTLDEMINSMILRSSLSNNM